MISLIVTISQNNAIGKDNKILFNIKENFDFFTDVTKNKTLIVGRKTFESFPRLFSDKKCIVITRDKNYKINHPLVDIRHDLDSLLRECADLNEEIFIVGGGDIYRYSIETGLVDKLYITKVNEPVYGADTLFPKIEFYSNYKEVHRKKLNEKTVIHIYKNYKTKKV